MGRDASEIAVSVRQNFLNQPPVPEVPTVTGMPAFAFWNSSAMASLMGKTVLEPSTAMTVAGVLGAEPPHPTAPSVTADTTAMDRI